MVKRTVKRVVLDGKLTQEEAKRYAELRAKAEAEIPKVVEETRRLDEEIREILSVLRESREQAGLSLSDLQARSGIDRAALSRLETGPHENPTLGTLVRYARALGKRVSVSLVEAPDDEPVTAGKP